VPELPEVETIVRDLAPLLAGRTLHHPQLHKSDVLRRVSRRRLLQTLDGNRLEQLTRRAKHLVFLLASGHRMVIQLRMTGSLLVHRRPLQAAERRYAVLEVELGGRSARGGRSGRSGRSGRGGRTGGDGERLVFRDVRRLGTIHLLDERAWCAYTGRIGREPLDADFDLARFRTALDGTTQAIKKVLMDQRRLAGVGNIYANEALFLAGVDPSRPANRLDDDATARLFDAVRGVLAAAVGARGTTVRDYRTGTGQSGGYQAALNVYDRAGEPCVRCGTQLATTHAIDGRQTTFCWRCQGGRPTPGRGTGDA
jgi:formamidopyrimidine-DNA glycosylase